MQNLEEVAVLISYLTVGFYTSVTGGVDTLIIMVQWLFLADFFIGIFSNIRMGFFTWSRVLVGIKKIASLYFTLTIVALGVISTEAFMISPDLWGYTPNFIFNAFVFILIIFELQAINRHFARMDLQINIILDIVLTKLTSQLFTKVMNSIEKVGGNPNKNKEPFNKDLLDIDTYKENK